MYEKTVEISILYDFYGQLLTSRQKDILQLYYADDYSLGEISEEIGITRQAVHDTVKKAEKALKSYEEKLGLALRFQKTESLLKTVEQKLERIAFDYKQDQLLTERLLEIKNIIAALEE